MVFALVTLSLVTVARTASAQLLVAKDGPVVYGHHHLNTTNMAAQKRFFVDTLGGTAIKIGTNNAEIVKFPNVLISSGDAGADRRHDGTTVNHIGFSVPNLRPVVDKIKANGYKMITRAEVAATQEIKDDIARLPAGTVDRVRAWGPKTSRSSSSK